MKDVIEIVLGISIFISPFIGIPVALLLFKKKPVFSRVGIGLLLTFLLAAIFASLLYLFFSEV